jgi:hypothetical protein
MDYSGHAFGYADHEEDVYDLADAGPTKALTLTPTPASYGYRPSAPPLGMHISGTQLRRRLITAEARAAIHTEAPRRSLVQDLLSRVRKRS